MERWKVLAGVALRLVAVVVCLWYGAAPAKAFDDCEYNQCPWYINGSLDFCGSECSTIYPGQPGDAHCTCYGSAGCYWVPNV